MVTIRASSNKSYNIYDTFKTYYNNNDVKTYFETQNWQELLPMLKQSTIDKILNNELNFYHSYSKNIAYFYGIYADDKQDKKSNVLFAIQINIEECE